MRKQLLRWLACVAGFYAASALLPSVRIGGAGTLVLAGTVLWLAGLFIRPILLLLGLPFNILTMGLFTLVVNAWMVDLADAIVPGLTVPGFWQAVLAGLCVSAARIILGVVIQE